MSLGLPNYGAPGQMPSCICRNPNIIRYICLELRFKSPLDFKLFCIWSWFLIHDIFCTFFAESKEGKKKKTSLPPFLLNLWGNDFPISYILFVEKKRGGGRRPTIDYSTSCDVGGFSQSCDTIHEIRFPGPQVHSGISVIGDIILNSYVQIHKSTLISL